MYGGMNLCSKDKMVNDVVCRRYDIVQARVKDRCTVKFILRKYDISRPTFYRYFNRFKKFGMFGLRDLSRAPKHNVNKTCKKDEEKLVNLHRKYPYLSSYELSEICGLSYKAIQRIRKRNDLKKEYMPKSQKKTLLKKLKRKYLKIVKENREKRLQKKKSRK